MRIRDGRFTYTGREQIQKAMDNKDKTIAELRSKLGTIAYYAEAQKELHKPYISGTLDVSAQATINKAESLCNQIKRNLWCSECSTSWPCRKIEEARILQRFAQGHLEEEQEEEFKTRIRNMVPKEKKGQLEVHV